MKNNKVIIAIAIVLVLAVVVAIVLIPKDGKNANKATDKTIQILDENLGYKTTFTYPEEERFVVTKTDPNNGRSIEISFENVPLNLEATVYYSMMTREQFENKKEEVKDYKHYKTYTIGGYDAFVYSGYDNDGYLIIMIDDEKGESLFFELGKKVYSKEGTIMDIVDSEAFQNLLNTIKYERI